MGIKRADLIGSWYPGTERECRKMIEEFLEKISLPDEDYLGIGGIVPHAGWFFSGKTATAVYSAIKHAVTIELVFLFGMHLPPGSENYIFVDEGYETPFGPVYVSREATGMMLDSFSFVEEDAVNYVRDNTIEIQLPFIKYFFPEATVVACGISPGSSAIEIGKKASEISKSLEYNTCFIGSTDLTHYGPNYGFVSHGTGIEALKWVKEVNDKRIVELFLEINPKTIMEEAELHHNACCPGAAAAATSAVSESGARKGILVDYSTSYDVMPNSSFVGYAGVVY